MLGFTFKNGLHWIEGALEGIAHEGNLPGFGHCLSDVEKVEPELDHIIDEFHAGNRSDAILDIAYLVIDVYNGFYACIALKNSTDIKRLVYWFTQFGDWDKVITIIISNTAKNYRAIYNLGMKMVDDADAGNWNLSGHDFAYILPLALGPVPTNPPAHMFF